MAEMNGDKIIVFKTPDGDWGEFSNQYRAPFTYMGIRFESVEQFLYYMRAVFGRSKATAEKILECGGDSAALVKTSKKQRLLENNSWEEVRQQIMRLGMRQKFLQNPELRKKLLSTGFRLLVEIPKEGLLDRILPPSEEWVRDPSKWKNRNTTGKALMRVRADLRSADRLVGADEAYVFPKAPFILQTPVGKMTLQEISALPGAKESVRAYLDTARQYLELFLATPDNVGNLNRIPLVTMERVIAGNAADIESTLNRAKARAAAEEAAKEAAKAAAEEAAKEAAEAPEPAQETAAEGFPDAETPAVPEEQAAAPAAGEVIAENTAVSPEEETNAAPAAVLEFGAEPAAISEEAPEPVPLTEEPSRILQEGTEDIPAEELPDDIPEEGFYALLYDLDEMMKLGLI